MDVEQKEMQLISPFRKRGFHGLLATWLMTVLPEFVGAQSISNQSFYVTGGTTHSDSPVRFAMLEGRRLLTPHVNYAAALVYLDGRRGYEDLQLRLMASASVTGSGWSLDARQLISRGSSSEDRFRSRVRLVKGGLFGHERLSARAFDEIHISLGGAGVLRNNYAAGLGFQASSGWNLELYHLWEDNRSTSNGTYWLLMATHNVNWFD